MRRQFRFKMPNMFGARNAAGRYDLPHTTLEANLKGMLSKSKDYFGVGNSFDISEGYYFVLKHKCKMIPC